MVGGETHGLDPIEEGIRLFNDRYFFEAHEVLEGVWREEHGEPRLFLQGLIQIGAMTLLERGAEKIRHYPPGYLGIDAAPLLDHIEADRARLGRMQRGEEPEAPLDFPRIERKLQT